MERRKPSGAATGAFHDMCTYCCERYATELFKCNYGAFEHSLFLDWMQILGAAFLWTSAAP
jgi:hypothetical protein